MRPRARKSVAIVGSGHIGTDLLFKLRRSEILEPRWMVGIDAGSAGLEAARRLGLETTSDGIEALLASAERPDLIFEATSAAVHERNAPRYRALGIRAVDLTPAAVGPYVVPPINLESLKGEPNVNLVTCGGQATTPMVHAVSRVVRVEYAEIVASIASASAGPGTRANIDEFTRTTSRALEVLGGAERGKAIIVLNPAEPPMIMRNTVFCSIPPDADRAAIAGSVLEMEKAVREYVPGYRLLSEPQFLADRVEILLEIEGAGDFLPRYAGNLDIITSAAVRVGERLMRGAEGGDALL
ncbi:MAG: acetaldehyde dehydrogenase (acetylating) [Myxococcota bacterium]